MMAVTPVHVKMDILTLGKALIYTKNAWTSTNAKKGHMIVEIIKNATILLAHLSVHVPKGLLRLCHKTMVTTTVTMMSMLKMLTKKLLTLEKSRVMILMNAHKWNTVATLMPHASMPLDLILANVILDFLVIVSIVKILMNA